MITNSALRRVLLALPLLAAVGCGGDTQATWDGWDSYGRPGKRPVAKVIDQFKELREITFYPVPDTSWTDLVDLSVFAGFWPGMTGQDAIRAVGEPDEHYERDGEQYWVYRRDGAKIAVALKHQGSLFFGRWWRLEAELDPPLPPSRVLHPSVLEELPRDVDRLTVLLMNNEGRPAVSVTVEDGRIVGLDWINNPGSGGARDGRSIY